jgi:hypothetical protein
MKKREELRSCWATRSKLIDSATHQANARRQDILCRFDGIVCDRLLCELSEQRGNSYRTMTEEESKWSYFPGYKIYESKLIIPLSSLGPRAVWFTVSTGLATNNSD